MAEEQIFNIPLKMLFPFIPQYDIFDSDDAVFDLFMFISSTPYAILSLDKLAFISSSLISLESTWNGSLLSWSIWIDWGENIFYFI